VVKTPTTAAQRWLALGMGAASFYEKALRHWSTRMQHQPRRSNVVNKTTAEKAI